MKKTLKIRGRRIRFSGDRMRAECDTMLEAGSAKRYANLCGRGDFRGRNVDIQILVAIFRITALRVG